jgi:hypothetical protein
MEVIKVLVTFHQRDFAVNHRQMITILLRPFKSSYALDLHTPFRRDRPYRDIYLKGGMRVNFFNQITLLHNGENRIAIFKTKTANNKHSL